MTSFSELKLSESRIKGVAALDYHEMTPIQAAALPLILAGHDVIAQAQTGSGIPWKVCRPLRYCRIGGRFSF